MHSTRVVCKGRKLGGAEGRVHRDFSLPCKFISEPARTGGAELIEVVGCAITQVVTHRNKHLHKLDISSSVGWVERSVTQHMIHLLD